MIYNLGRVVPIFKGNYNSATTYNFLDVVFYDNSSFVALDTTTGNLPTDTTHWLPVALKGTTQNPTPAQMQEIISAVETYMYETDFVHDPDYTHIDVVDNHTSTSTTNALAANQGKVLYELIDNVSHTASDLNNTVSHLVVDNLTTNDATKALSAKQGKILGDVLFTETTLNLMDNAVVLTGTAIRDTGEFNTGSSYTSYKITNNNYTSVFGVASTYSHGYVKVAFYNGEPSTSTFISGISQSVNYVAEEYNSVVPDGCVYIILTRYSTATESTCYTSVMVNNLQELSNTVGGFDDSINTLSTSVSNLSNSVNSLSTDVDGLGDTVEYFVNHSLPITKTVADDFTITGYYKNETADGMNTGYNYISLPLQLVSEGQTVYLHNWKVYTVSVGVLWCYDNDGLPYNGSNNARITSTQLTTISEGEYTYTIPSNCSQLGISISPTYPENAYVVIGDESFSLTDEAKDLINDAVVQEDDEAIGDKSANYYLKGNSNIVYSPTKKLGIIAAGQSNIDGRNSYSDLPSGFVNPNPKVQICKNTNGTFSNFQITDGGNNNDWSFDAIVYDALTNPSYGNQSEIYVMKKSMGGTSIDIHGATDYHWTADYEYINPQTHSLLRTFEQTIRKGIETQGENFEIKAFLWHQGEGDANYGIDVANRYYDNLKNMLAYVRGVVGNPRLHFFCGNISNNNHADAYKNIVNAAYDRLASEDPYFHLVDMRNAVLEDSWHFNYIWSIYFGQKVYDMMIDAGIISGTKINPTEPV